MVLAGADPFEIQRCLGVSKLPAPCWWRHYVAGVDDLFRDKTRPPDKAPLGDSGGREDGDGSAAGRYSLERVDDGESGKHRAVERSGDLYQWP